MGDFATTPGSGESASREHSARQLFKRFLAERWFGGPDFESWIRRHAELEAELRRLRDEWLAELRDPDSPGLVPEGERGARSAASYRAGEILGGFRLLERIGSGASGEVWKADELALGRVVALKLLRPDLLLNPHANERFRREALAGARVQHAGVVTVHSIGRAQGQPFIAQELVEGGRTLAAWIQEQRALGPLGAAHFLRAAEWIAQAAEALAAAHAQGIFHRDIKPQNLLLTPDERIKVADFGLAHLAGEFSISHPGDVLGTIPYMSPSQVRGEIDQLDARSDVFSLGATLYELATLERAFPGTTLAEIAHRVQHGEPRAPRRIQPKLPADLELILMRALEKDAGDRYASMLEFSADLRRFLAGEPPLARSSSLRGRLRKWRRRHPTLAVGLALASLALGGIGWQALERRESERAHVVSQLRALEARIQLAIELGDIDTAARLVLESDRLASDEPTAHLILAVGYMRLGRGPDWERELALARERGFRMEPAALRSAIEHGAYALYLVGRRDLALYSEAESHIDRALALDPSLYALEFTRYLLRVALGNQAGAMHSLLAFQRRIPPGEDLYQMVEVLRLEGEGRPADALALLESLTAGLDETRRAGLRWQRTAGRLCVQLGQLERAEGLLLQAVAAEPTDCFSWDALAAVYQKRLQRGETALLTAARTHAEEARACSPSLPNAHYVLAYVAELELGRAGATDVSAHPAWGAAREALDRLHALGAGDTVTTRKLEAHLLVLAALPRYARGERAELVEPLTRALELDGDHLQAAALLGECLYLGNQPARGLDVLEHALERLDEPSAGLVCDAHWQGVLIAWSLANAGAVPDRVAFERSRDRLQHALAQGVRFPKEELINAAEFLAVAPEEFRVCDLAWRLVDEYGLETAFAGTPQEDAVRKILAEIAAACP